MTKKAINTSNILPAGLVSYFGEMYSYIHYVRKIRDRRNYIYDVYGRLDPRWGPDWDKDIRRKGHLLLSESNKFRYGGGLSKVRYIQYVQEAARSKICIDLPGDGDFCSRLADYFAIGSCVISVKHRTTLQAPLVDREHIVYAKDDLSDLVDLCYYYLKHDDERERISTQ